MKLNLFYKVARVLHMVVCGGGLLLAGIFAIMDAEVLWLLLGVVLTFGVGFVGLLGAAQPDAAGRLWPGVCQLVSAPGHLCNAVLYGVGFFITVATVQPSSYASPPSEIILRGGSIVGFALSAVVGAMLVVGGIVFLVRRHKAAPSQP